VNPALKAWTRALELTAPIEHRGLTLPQVIDELAELHGDAPALVAPHESLSYRELAQAVRRYARWGLSAGFAPGEVVGLLMPNSPHYFAIWLGLSRIGVTTALLNTHLSGERLSHCIRAVSPRAIVVAPALIDALQSARPGLARSLPAWAFGDGSRGLPRLDSQASGLSCEPLADGERPAPSLDSRALYIYTSGTTGLPKAAAISHLRVMQWSHWFAGMMDASPTDRLYNCLPMYHSIGGVVATAAPLVGGGTVVVRESFSATGFWPDVVAQRCTLFQYIGELCRYLIGNPPQPQETQHQLRLCCGNGLRAQVWTRFQDRFRIPRILEYYASTEGSFSLYNCEGHPGAIGRIPAFLSHRLPVALVRYDAEAGAPARNAGGRCIVCGPNEPGEAIGQIRDASGKARGRFEGYADDDASEKKLLHDVFAAGDTWYRTGDLMRRDPQGFFYFVDRIGDTFRWKGENVSTGEVAAVITGCAGVADAAVYGVAIPGTDGKAGMAAIVAREAFDLAELFRHVAAQLPQYARPLFVRIVPAIALTGSYKLDKQALAGEGFDPSATSDAIYFVARREEGYVRVDAPLFKRICEGRVRL
jgi:fatty-acyl-CoA synthase